MKILDKLIFEKKNICLVFSNVYAPPNFIFEAFKDNNLDNNKLLSKH